MLSFMYLRPRGGAHSAYHMQRFSSRCPTLASGLSGVEIIKGAPARARGAGARPRALRGAGFHYTLPRWAHDAPSGVCPHPHGTHAAAPRTRAAGHRDTDIDTEPSLCDSLTSRGSAHGRVVVHVEHGDHGLARARRRAPRAPRRAQEIYTLKYLPKLTRTNHMDARQLPLCSDQRTPPFPSLGSPAPRTN